VKGYRKRLTYPSKQEKGLKKSYFGTWKVKGNRKRLTYPHQTTKWVEKRLTLSPEK
jgi:hypothetical protein